MRNNGIEIATHSTSDETHQRALIEGGGKSQVPCLRYHSNRGEVWLYESDDIIRYLRERYL